MRKAETKEKGDIGLTQVIANLQLNGITAALPLSEHLPFDLIAVNKDAKLSRVSIKYRAINTNGIIEIPLRTISSNSEGYKVKVTNLNEVDAFAIYCPDTNKCYYIPSTKLIGYKASMALSVGKSNNQSNLSTDYENPLVLFKK